MAIKRTTESFGLCGAARHASSTAHDISTSACEEELLVHEIEHLFNVAKVQNCQGRWLVLCSEYGLWK